MTSLQRPPSSVRVYACHALAFSAERQARFASLLDPTESARAARFVFDKHRRRFIAAHGFVREVFARETGRDARAFAFELGPSGKPRLASSDLHFSLTHTGEHALLAVGERELGLDAEEIRGERVDGPLARRVMTDQEFETWSRAARDEQVRAFFRLWSAKESVMKATGLGMQLSPASFAVFAPGTLALAESVALEAETWTLRELSGPSDIAVALATQDLAQVSQQAFL